jgi:hypothetical protein
MMNSQDLATPEMMAKKEAAINHSKTPLFSGKEVGVPSQTEPATTASTTSTSTSTDGLTHVRSSRKRQKTEE